MGRRKKRRLGCANSQDGRREWLLVKAPSVTHILRASPASGQAAGLARGEGYSERTDLLALREPKWAVAR